MKSLQKTLSIDFKIKFVDISNDFKLPEGFIWTGKNIFGLGYSLMCRFNYFGVWDYLKDYQIAIRIDEDCIIHQFPEINKNIILLTGALSNESHEPTNLSFKKYLKGKNLEKYYDQQFPYTNVFITSVHFWLRPDVKEFLTDIALQNNSIEDRWGDLPVLGVALKIFGNWVGMEAVDKRIVYEHLSHNSEVEHGEVKTK